MSVKRRVVVYHDDVKDEGYFKGHRERKGLKTTDNFSVAQFVWNEGWEKHGRKLI